MTPEHLYAARAAMHLTQRAFASALGISRRTIQRYESGKHRIPQAIELAVKSLKRKSKP